MLIRRHHGQIVQLGGGDDETVARIVVNRRQAGGGDANIQCERQNRQAVMFDNFFKPFQRRVRQREFSFGRLDRNLKTADGGNIDRRRLVDPLEGCAADFLSPPASQSSAQVSRITGLPPAIPRWPAARWGRI
jgi:hypothetical protein